MKKNAKKVVTLVLTAAMVIGCTITAFADDPTPGVSEGTGSYEGGEMQYPTLQVTLPTIPEGTYDYIADPNGLIAATSAAKYPDSAFTGTTGIFFLTTKKTAEAGSKDTYTDKSAAQELTNQNAQDIDVTVKLEQKTAGSEGVAYSDTATFESTDKAKKLYLAVTDDAAQDPSTQALSATGAATLTATVAGKPTNYKPSYDSTNGYKYALKTKAENGDADLTWNSCSFKLVGALNKNATWEDGIDFPAIKVTWSYAEHTETPATSSAASIVVPESGNATIAITVGQDGAVPTSLTNTWFSGNMLQLTNGWGASYDASTKTITFADGISGDFAAEKAEALNATYTITFTPSEGDPYTQTVTFAE